MPTSQQPATNCKNQVGDAANPDQPCKPLDNKKGGRLREAVRSRDISVEQFLKRFY